jgi:NADPH:quinone reductase-like Zn-dependent oxidoreductase
MKAVAIDRYGDPTVLQLKEVDKPRLADDSAKPKLHNRVLIKVHATTVNPMDWKIRSGKFRWMPGNKLPLILGFDVCGEVVEVGSAVTQFQVGDRVYGALGLPGGADAEFTMARADWLAIAPTNLSDEEAAAVPGSALTALQALRDVAQLQAGQSVLINGASGGVGSFAVQIGKALGAEVTGVCSTPHLEMVKSLGADRVIDYTQEDFTAEARSRYDIIFDTVAKRSFAECQPALKPNGTYITTLPSGKLIWQRIWTAIFPGKKVKFVVQTPSGKDLGYLKELLEAGKIRAIVDRVYPLAELSVAHKYSESGHAAGKIVIKIA